LAIIAKNIVVLNHRAAVPELTSKKEETLHLKVSADPAVRIQSNVAVMQIPGYVDKSSEYVSAMFHPINNTNNS